MELIDRASGDDSKRHLRKCLRLTFVLRVRICLLLIRLC
jgi:hypothetical protein